MSWRQIHSSIAHSESLTSLSHDAERLFWRLLVQTDPWGRLKGEPAKVRAICAPLMEWSLDHVEGLLTELVEARRVDLYEANRRLFIQLLDFDEHQPELVRKRGSSVFPANSRGAEGRGVPEKGAEFRGRALKKEKEKERREEKDKPSVSAEVQEVYDCWRDLLGKSDPRYEKISERRFKVILARCKDGFSVTDLKQALRAVADDDWPERVKHNDLTVVFRHREDVERWLDNNSPSELPYQVATPGEMF